MTFRVLADLVLFVHAAFVVFVVVGAALVAWRPGFIWLHVPAVLWGAWIEFSGGTCPLTPLENRLRRIAGDTGYPGGFVEHYLLAALYPDGLTRTLQVTLGCVAVAINVGAYAWWWRGRRSAGRRRPVRPP